MALHREEVQILPTGTEDSTLGKGAFIQNMFVKNGAWEVRPGFGQVAQFDTTMLAPSNTATDKGYRAHIASKIFRTDFDHIQIVSLFATFCYSGDWISAELGDWIMRYAVSIYDTTTGRRWEELLYRRTGDNTPNLLDMENWFPHYQTNRKGNHEVWLSAETQRKPVFFTEYQDNLIFGGNDIGLWAYIPADFDDTRDQQVDYLRHPDGASPYGESSKIVRITPEDGQFTDAYRYLDSASFPVPVDAAVIDNRVAIASGRDVYFSDIGKPNAIMGINILSVPCDGEITAVDEIGGSLAIFTLKETWLYQPNVGTVVSSGRLTRVSDSVGCMGPSALLSAQSLLFWADERGVYACDGSLKVQELGGDISDAFLGGLSNPLTSYYQNQGAISLASEQPRTFYKWGRANDVHMSYDSLHGLLFVGFPSQRMAYVRQGQSWAVWNFESFSSSTATQVAATANIPNPWILALEGDVWCVSSSETEVFDGTEEDGSDTSRMNSYAILKMGHGGAVDRSVETVEDNRKFNGHYREALAPSASGSFYVLGKPVVMPIGYKLPRGGAQSAVVHMIPVYICPHPKAPASIPTDTGLRFEFDETKWLPVLVAGTAEIDFVLPPERDAGKAGFGYGAPAATRNVSRTNAAGALLASGDHIQVDWDGATAAGVTGTNMMSLARDHLNPLVWLPFVRTGSGETTGIGVGSVPSSLISEDRGGTTDVCGLYVWNFGDIPKHTQDATVQPVDWVMKCAQVGLKDGWQVMARTLYLKLLSHGKATTRINPNWIHGLVNLSLSSDWKDWASQVVDFSGNLTSAQKVPLRARMKNVAGGMDDKTFNNAANWATAAQPTLGNLLVDDEQYDTISMSSRVRGEHVSHMLFGHMANRAERLAIDTAKAVMKRVGQRRRRGR